MILSKYFTLSEMVFSQTATRWGIDNTPGAAEVENLRRLCVKTLDPIREMFGRPVVISSGYRCPELNTLISGSRTSQHMKGQAADFSVPGLDVADVFRRIIEARLDVVPFDQVINEFNEWIHISYNTPLRREKLIAYRDGGKTHFRRI